MEDKWTYTILASESWSSFAYRVIVYCNGRKIGEGHTDTKWGARKKAKRMKREFINNPPPGTVFVKEKEF